MANTFCQKKKWVSKSIIFEIFDMERNKSKSVARVAQRQRKGELAEKLRELYR